MESWPWDSCIICSENMRVEHNQYYCRKCKKNRGPWTFRTLPSGYMEMGESATEGAIRETFEEAAAEVQVLSLFAHLDIPRIGQTYIIFLAKLKTPHFSPGPESSECRLYALDDIPFDSLAFSSMLVTLNLYIEDLKIGRPKFHYGIINKRYFLVQLRKQYAGLAPARLRFKPTPLMVICSLDKERPVRFV